MPECSFFNKWRRKSKKCSKSNVLIVVVYHLNVKKVNLQKNVPTALGMSAVVGLQYKIALD